MTAIGLMGACEVIGMGLSLAMSAGALALAGRAGRREAEQQFRWHRNATLIGFAQQDARLKTVIHALNEHGLMDGPRIVPARPEPPSLYRPEADQETGT